MHGRLLDGCLASVLELGISVLLVGAEDRDDLSPLGARDRLALRLEQMNGLAVALCQSKTKVRDKVDGGDLLERYGICFSCSSQYSESLMACS